jgi:hypothetical protein
MAEIVVDQPRCPADIRNGPLLWRRTGHAADNEVGVRHVELRVENDRLDRRGRRNFAHAEDRPADPVIIAVHGV